MRSPLIGHFFVCHYPLDIIIITPYCHPMLNAPAPFSNLSDLIVKFCIWVELDETARQLNGQNKSTTI